MELDAQCLLEARLENVERLAVALGVRLPLHKRHSARGYTRELVRLVLRRIEQQQRDAVLAARAKRLRPD